jgi:hypothetical protein
VKLCHNRYKNCLKKIDSSYCVKLLGKMKLLKVNRTTFKHLGCKGYTCFM